MADYLFLTELVGLKVFDLKGRALGRVKDAAVVPLIDASRVDRYLIGGDGVWLTVRYDQVSGISLDGIQLRDEVLTPYHSDEYMLRMVRDLLDQQIIDAHGRKVVRVTDVTFGIEKQSARDVLVVHDIDIGLRSIFRRLCQGIVPPRWVRRLQRQISPNSIDWKMCSIVEADPMRRLRLNISNRLLEEMHPADLADIVEDLGPEDREAIFASIDSEVAADTLSEIDPEIQASILESLDTDKAADIVEEMSPAEAADVLSELEDETAGEILAEMESEPKTEVRELLEFDDDIAGGMMNTEFVALQETATVADALAAFRENEEVLESLNTIFLLDGRDRLTAAVPVVRLFGRPPETALKSLAPEKLKYVRVTDRQPRVIEIFDKYNLLYLAVIDETGQMAGVITADDIISLLRER